MRDAGTRRNAKDVLLIHTIRHSKQRRGRVKIIIIIKQKREPSLSDIQALRAFCFQEVKKMDDFFDDGFDWQDWMIIGPLSEDIAEEKRERDMFEDDEDSFSKDVSNLDNKKE